MLIEEIKSRINKAILSKNEAERDILKVALGEIQTIESRQGKITEEQCQKVIRKIIEGNHETITAYISNYKTSSNESVKLLKENEILKSLLPQSWSESKIAVFLMDNSKPYCNEICDAKSDGQAIGVAMKYLRQEGASVESKVVASVVKAIRND